MSAGSTIPAPRSPATARPPNSLTSAVATNVIGNGPGSTVFGILTASPTYALVEVNYDTGTPQYTVQLMRASTPTIYANGTLTCP